MSKKQKTAEADPAGDPGAQGVPGAVRVQILEDGVHAAGLICGRGAVINVTYDAAQTLEKLKKARILGV